MTTIVYKHDTKELASDSQTTLEGRIDSLKADKIHKYGEGWIGFAGHVPDWHLVMDVLKREEWGYKFSDNLQSYSIVMQPKEVYCLWTDSSGMLRKEEVKGDYALGSGAPLALGALSVGASITEAVEAAIKYDIYSGGEVKVVSLK